LEATKGAAVTAQDVRDCPDIRARADAKIEPNLALSIRDDVERVNTRAPRRHVDVHAAPCELVRALPTDLHGRYRGDRELHVTAEAPEPKLELLRCRRLAPRDDRALRIAGGRSSRQVDIGDVALVQSDEARSKLSCPPGQQEQQ